jgi:hypothetical protein
MRLILFRHVICMVFSWREKLLCLVKETWFDQTL